MPGHTGDWNMYFTWARADNEDGVCEQTSWETDDTGHAPEITVDGAPAKPATMDPTLAISATTPLMVSSPCHPRQSQKRYHLYLKQPSAISSAFDQAAAPCRQPH
ncbi:unnamed protein product, partial [Ectocarpus sp. 12 AP-2014]